MAIDDGLDKETWVAVDEVTTAGYQPDSNFVFFLYRRVTIFIIRMMILCIVIFQASDLGDMSCYRGGQCSCDDKTLSSYCWVQGTHTVRRHTNRTVGVQVPNPGIGQVHPDDEPVYHYYYIWVIPVLFIADILFNAPWWMWKKYWEGRRIIKFMQSLNILVVEKPETLKENKEQLIAYFTGLLNDRIHNRLAIRYICCEIANFLHVLGQLVFTNYLLNGEFSQYGFQTARFLVGDQESRVDPMTKVFPLVTTCHLILIGPSGNDQLVEGICVMPLNSLFSKVFILLWFWYVLLAIASTLGLIYRTVTIYVPPVRYWLLRIRASSCSSAALHEICNRCSYGDWLLLFTLKNVVDCFFYDDILEAVSENLKQKRAAGMN